MFWRLRFINILEDNGLHVEHAVFVDRIYMTEHLDIAYLLPKTRCSFIPSFFDLLKFMEKKLCHYDLIVSFGFQSSIYYKNVENAIVQRNDENWKMGCCFQQLQKS